MNMENIMKKTLLKKLLSLTIVITLLAMPLTGCVSTSSSTTATATHECSILLLHLQ